MKTMFSAGDRAAIVERINRLTPEHSPKWGKMNVSQMIVHLADAVRMATGELPVKSKKLPVRFSPIKELIIYVFPFPKSAPTAKELLSRVPAEWTNEREDLLRQIDHLATLAGKTDWPDHPAFGKLSRTDWGVLGYKHCDHHLKQFGV